jgi:hypothetical protein
LRSIDLPGSLELIQEWCFACCYALASVRFGANSRLSRLGQKVFYESGLQSIHLPGSLEVICEQCFSNCFRLTSVTFDPHSRIRPRVSDLGCGIGFNCHFLEATRNVETSSHCCSAN